MSKKKRGFKKGNTIGVRFGEGQDPTKGGRPKVQPMRDILKELEEGGYELAIPRDQCKISRKEIIVSLPSKEALALKIFQNSFSDVRWLREFLKVTGEYAPTKVASTDSDGNDIKYTAVTLDDLLSKLCKKCNSPLS